MQERAVGGHSHIPSLFHLLYPYVFTGLLFIFSFTPWASLSMIKPLVRSILSSSSLYCPLGEASLSSCCKSTGQWSLVLPNVAPQRLLLLQTRLCLSRSCSWLGTPLGVSSSLAAVKRELQSIHFSWDSLILPHRCQSWLSMLLGVVSGAQKIIWYKFIPRQVCRMKERGAAVHCMKWSSLSPKGAFILLCLHVRQLDVLLATNLVPELMMK